MRIEKLILLVIMSSTVISCQTTGGKLTAEDILKENNVVRAGKFESQEGGFKVDFPCEPINSELPTESDYGNKLMTTYECGNEIAHFSVSYQDFTKPVKDLKKFFKEQQKLRFEGMEDSAKIVSQTEKTINNFPGIYFETEQNASEIFPRSALFDELSVLKEKRYYSVWTTVLAKDGQTPKDVGQEIRDKTKQFVDSFELIESK